MTLGLDLQPLGESRLGGAAKGDGCLQCPCAPPPSLAPWVPGRELYGAAAGHGTHQHSQGPVGRGRPPIPAATPCARGPGSPSTQLPVPCCPRRMTFLPSVLGLEGLPRVPLGAPGLSLGSATATKHHGLRAQPAELAFPIPEPGQPRIKVQADSVPGRSLVLVCSVLTRQRETGCGGLPLFSDDTHLRL